MAESLLALAPRQFANWRQERYQGDDVCVALTELAESDRTLVLGL